MKCRKARWENSVLKLDKPLDSPEGTEVTVIAVPQSWRSEEVKPVGTLIGVVKDGVIVLEGGVTLPEGTRVRIEIVATEPGWIPEEEEEFLAWERASDVAWSLIDQEEEVTVK